jgi:hypothetical protein
MPYRHQKRLQMNELIQLVRKPTENNPHYSYTNDIQAMREALNRRGYDASIEDIVWAWEQHSESWAAGWLIMDALGGPDGTVKYLLGHLIPSEGSDPAMTGSSQE